MVQRERQREHEKGRTEEKKEKEMEGKAEEVAKQESCPSCQTSLPLSLVPNPFEDSRNEIERLENAAKQKEERGIVKIWW